MLQSPELDGANERCLIEAAAREWTPLARGALDGAADILDRLGDNATLLRERGERGRQIVTASGVRAGVAWRGQGSTIGEALRNLRAVA